MHLRRPQVRLVQDHVAIPIEAGLAERRLHKLPHRPRHPSRDHIVTRFVLLKHQPHRFHVVLRMAPVPLGVEVAHAQLLRLSRQNLGDPARHFARDEVLAAAG